MKAKMTRILEPTVKGMLELEMTPEEWWALYREAQSVVETSPFYPMARTVMEFVKDNVPPK